MEIYNHVERSGMDGEDEKNRIATQTNSDTQDTQNIKKKREREKHLCRRIP